MPAQALYLKYRPHTFAEVEGQEHITRTLRNALAKGRVAHAYLFTGPRGTGKTTMARLLAKAVNCVGSVAPGDRPCNECEICRAINDDRMLDLIEIDAASNTGVDDIRDLRDKVDFRPGQSEFKVYIIDEVHMLSNPAFNALLKTLEEPPPHVIFVLATTDPQKIPATVISRVQRFDFRRLTLPEITSRLGAIAAKESLKVEPAALELIARHATGAMRDAISLLDQLASYGGDDISLVQVQGLLGAGSYLAIAELVARLAAKDVPGGLAVIANSVDGGADPRQLAREIVEYLRAVMLIQAGSGATLTQTADAQAEMADRAGRITRGDVIRAIRLFSQAAYELRASTNPTLPLEIAFVEATLQDVPPAVVGGTPRTTTAEAGPASIDKALSKADREVSSVAPAPKADESSSSPKGAEAPAAADTAKPHRRPPSPVAQATKAGDLPAPQSIGESSPATPLSLEGLRANWAQVLARVKVYNKVAEALLRSDAEPVTVEGDQVVLGFHHEVHAGRFDKVEQSKVIVEKALGEVLQAKCRVKFILSPKRAKIKAAEEDPLIHAAMSMGAEITDIHEGE